MYGVCLYKDFYNYIYGKRLYISESLIRDIGGSEWYSQLHEFVGVLVIDRRNGIAVDTLYMELVELFPWIFTGEEVAEQDQLDKILNTYRQARREKKIERCGNDTGG